MDPINILKKDPILYRVIKQIGSYEIKLTRNPYESLIEAIITQQLSGAAAKSISKKFHDMFPKKFPTPVDVINTTNSKLRNAGLSKMKVDYIKDLSKKIEEKKINFRSLSKMSDEEIITNLTQVKGIGRWTAEMFLIFTLGRMDVLPVGDLGLQKGVKRLYSLDVLPNKSQLEDIAKKWIPCRTVATWYIWKSLKQFDSI